MLLGALQVTYTSISSTEDVRTIAFVEERDGALDVDYLLEPTIHCIFCNWFVKFCTF